MKKILLFAISLVFAFTTNAQMTNGGFETWTGENPDGWVGAKTSGGITVTKVTDDVHAGSNACGVKNTYDSGHARFTTTAMTVTSGTAYTISFWAKGTGQYRTSMYTAAESEGAGYVGYSEYADVSTDWTQLSGIVTSDADTDVAEFIIDLGTAAEFIIDDVTISGFAANTEANISSFSLSAVEKSPAVIDATANTVVIEVVSGTDVTALVPAMEISNFATISPAMNVAQDFTSPVTYTVTAEDGTEAIWTVTVNVSTVLNDAKEIVTFNIEDAEGVITDTTVMVTVAFNADLTTLVPTITVSTGATIDPATGVAQDFTAPVTYTVTAQDGTTQELIVTVVNQSQVSIYDIQNVATAASYTDKVVATTGVVGAIKDNAFSGSKVGYYIQDGSGPYSGIYVQGSDGFSVGDSVMVTGTVVESYSYTTLVSTSAIFIEEDKTLEVTEITAAQANTEEYESVLVSVTNMVCATTANTYDVWTATQDGVTIQISGALLPSGSFDGIAVGTTYSATGFMMYGYSAFSILPRTISDVAVGIDEVTIANIDIYPNPVNNELNINNIEDFSSIKVSNLLGQTVSQINVTSSNVKVDFNNLETGIYFVSLYEESSLIKTYKIVKK